MDDKQADKKNCDSLMTLQEAEGAVRIKGEMVHSTTKQKTEADRELSCKYKNVCTLG